MIPIITYLGVQGVETELLWWALAFGVGFGGNGSPIGSTAGVIVVAKSEKTENPISFIDWIKQGVPTMILGLTVATLAIILVPEYFSGPASSDTESLEHDIEISTNTLHRTDTLSHSL